MSKTSENFEAILAKLNSPKDTDWERIRAMRAQRDAERAEREAESRAEWDSIMAEGRANVAWRTGVLSVMRPTIAYADCVAIIRNSLESKRALVASMRWLLESKVPMLLLAGTPGTCKSVSAHAVGVEWAQSEAAKEVARHRSSVDGDVKWRLGRLESDMKGWARHSGAFVVPAPSIPRTFDPWRNEGDAALHWTHPFLIVDDLGTEADSSRWTEAFGRLVDERLSCDPEKVRTVITTNLSKKDIRPRYGDRIADRLNAHSLAVELAGPSERGTRQGL